MTRRILASTLLLSLLSLTPALRAQDAPPAAPAPSAAPKEEKPKTDLEKNMDNISRAYRTLRRQIADPTKNDSSLEQVAAIRTAVQAASQLTPAKAADLAEADRPQFVADFQAGMKDFTGALDKLEADLKANNNTAAADDLKQMQSIEGTNHKKFRRPEEKKN